jgi:hypothetical protein
MKIRAVEPSCSMRADGRAGRQAGMTKLVVALRNFANVPKNVIRVYFYVCLFHEAAGLVDCVTLHDRMRDEWKRIWKEVVLS